MAEQKALSTAMALFLTSAVMAAILASVFMAVANRSVLVALAKSNESLVELNQKIGDLTNTNTRARRAQAAKLRQLRDFCASGVIKDQELCNSIPQDAVLENLER